MFDVPKSCPICSLELKTYRGINTNINNEIISEFEAFYCSKIYEYYYHFFIKNDTNYQAIEILNPSLTAAISIYNDGKIQKTVMRFFDKSEEIKFNFIPNINLSLKNSIQNTFNLLLTFS